MATEAEAEPQSEAEPAGGDGRGAATGLTAAATMTHCKQASARATPHGRRCRTHCETTNRSNRLCRMTKTLLPLDSYRLAEYAVPVPCYICHEGNSFDAERCRHCAAPMALAHQAQTQKVRPRMMAVLGTSGVGKTVYLGMLLDMLSRRPERMQILARGRFRSRCSKPSSDRLPAGSFPAKRRASRNAGTGSIANFAPRRAVGSLN